METADKKCDYHLKQGFSSRLAICFVRKSWNMKSGDLRYLPSYDANTLRQFVLRVLRVKKIRGRLGLGLEFSVRLL
jgi:hypothetical protein